MKLQTKVVLIMAGAWLFICSITYAYFKFGTTVNYQHLETAYRYLIIEISSGLLVLLLTWYLLKTFILDRIISVNKQIAKMSKDNHFINKISLAGNDELTSLVHSINYMINIITESQNRLAYLASYDALTKLPNRTHFYELFKLATSRAKVNHTKMAVMFIDMDKLKRVNDTFGHSVGDQLIKAVAKRMQHVIKSTDVLARLSGDEFLLYLDNVESIEQAADTAKRLLATTAPTFVLGSVVLTTTLSIGISFFPTDGTTTDELIKKADEAMYKAKILSGNRYAFFCRV